MTMPSRIERNLPLILDELSAAPTPDYLDDVFGRTGRMRQRPAWTFPGRWIPMADTARIRAFAPTPPWRMLALSLLVIALLIVVAIVAVGSRRQPAPPFGPARNGEIVYTNRGDLFAGDPASGETHLLLGGPAVDSGPSYSPDGTRVAFLRTVSCCPDAYDIYGMRDDGSDLRKLTTSPIADLNYAQWAADSRHVAVIENTADGGKLFLLDSEGREAPRPLAPDMDVSDGAAFRPFGDEIAFRALVDEGWGIFAVNTDGTNIRPLMDPVPVEMGNHAANIEYSADGKRLFYQSYVPADGDMPEGCCQLWVMDADGRNAHAFVAHDTGSWSGVPSVSPDGRWVSYWYVGGSSAQVIRVAPADGTGLSIATGPVMSDFFGWSWSPDSSKILMMPLDASSSSAYLIDPEGGPYTTVPWETGIDVDWQRLSP